MTLVSGAIPNLVNGVSQQAYTQRLASQAEEQINFESSVVKGLVRRPPSRHLATLSGVGAGDVALHVINRDPAEQYIVALTASEARVFDLTGAAKTVTASAEALAYLNCQTPSTALRMVTNADYTFVVNTEKKTALAAGVTATRPKEALVNVRQGNYGKTYAIEIDGAVVAAHTTPNGGVASHAPEVDTSFIAAALETLLNAALDAQSYTVTRLQNVLHIAKASGDFAIAVSDGFNGDAMTVAKDRLQRFSDLPNRGPNGFHVEIAGDQSSAFDNYFVRFEKSDDADSAGVWIEAPAQGVADSLDAASMPHALVRQSDGSFELKPIDWAKRAVGDAASAPPPSFIGRTVNDVFFYRNRLGLLSDESVILSRAGDFFNFWPKTVTALVDSDPIDVAATHTQVSILRHAAPFNRALLLFADQTQFVMDGGDLLTPATVSLRPATEFTASPGAKPVNAGRAVFFAVEKGGHAGVREYLVESASETNDAAEITKHAPTYIPDGVFHMAAASHEDVLIALSRGAPDSLFVYRYYWSRDEKLQSSWSRWTLEGAELLSAAFLDQRLIVAVRRSGAVFLEAFDLDPGSAADQSLGWICGADRRVDETALTASYDDGANATTFALPYAEDGALWLVARIDGAGLKAGQAVAHTRPSATTLTASGDLTGAKLFVGRRYQSVYRFSPLVLRENAAGGGRIAIGEGRLQVLYLALFYEATGYFRVVVTPKARASYSYAFTGKRVGAGSAVIGDAGLETGRFKLPIYARNTDVAIEIATESFLPCAFMSAEWEGRFILRSRRLG